LSTSNTDRMAAAGGAAQGGSRKLPRQEFEKPQGDRNARDALAIFADEVSAYRYLKRLRWPDGVWCPHCRSAKVGSLNGASTHSGTYKCYSCRKLFSLLRGTLMSGSHVPPHKWLQAMYLTEGGAKPMRAHHLSRILDVSFKTASSMMRRISEAAVLPFGGPLFVEPQQDRHRQVEELGAAGRHL
jgi:transposase-like protein